VPPTTTFQWTGVSTAQAYRLYVGTATGLNDVADTFETQATSYTANNLPTNRTLYARIWTEVSGVWHDADITFRTAAPSTLVAPAAGAQNIPPTTTFQWTSVSTAQAYYLYVGTAVGLNDVVNTGEIQATSYNTTTLPTNRTLYARIWTKIAGTWLYTDTTFTTLVPSTLVTPATGATNVTAPLTFQWTAAANAQAYYLYVGTAVGLKDVVDTYEIQTTSYTASSLPAGRTLYARIWCKVNGQWLYTDSVWTTQ
jgi:hypothetical protein